MKGNHEDLRGVFAVPPLARRNDAARSFDFPENERIVKHISSGGLSRLIYGGIAFLYHIELAELKLSRNGSVDCQTSSG